jgi:hypothetical protein
LFLEFGGTPFVDPFLKKLKMCSSSDNSRPNLEEQKSSLSTPEADGRCRALCGDFCSRAEVSRTPLAHSVCRFDD